MRRDPTRHTSAQQGNTRVLACAPRLVKQAGVYATRSVFTRVSLLDTVITAEYVISVTTFGKPELYGLNPKHRIDEQHPTVRRVPRHARAWRL